MHDKRLPVEDAPAMNDTRAIRRHLDELVTRITTAATRRRGKDDVLAAVRTVPDPDSPHEPVNSL
jgi:hypothetical protein